MVIFKAIFGYFSAMALVVFAIFTVLLIAVVLFVGAFAFNWFTAGPKGALEARQQILSGPTRIAAYNHFFDACAGIQGLEASLEAQQTVLEQTEDTHTQDRIRINIAGITAERGRAIAKYNNDAAKDYTIGQFRDLDLPYHLNPNESKTTC